MSKKFNTNNNNNNFEIIRPNEEILPLDTNPTSPTSTTSPSMKVLQGVIADEDVSAMFDLSTAKKKKKTKKKQRLAEEVEEVEVVEVVSDTITHMIETDSPSYDYALLLDRVINTLSAKNPDCNDKPRNTVPAPVIIRLGAKKTLWINFKGLYDSIIND